MYLRQLSIVNFKNIRQCEIVFAPGINCFVGGNGSGKTNLIDAVHYLSMCKSAFNLSDGQCVNHDADFFMIDANFADEDTSNDVVVSFKKGASKLVKINGKEYDRLSDHIGVAPVVMISPYDTNLINESGEDRRKYLNALVSQLDRQYLNDVIRYNQLLAQRNKLLKQSGGDPEVLDIIDMRIAPLGDAISQHRDLIITKMSPLVQQYYDVLSDGSEQVFLSYKSELSENSYEALLHGARQRDAIMQHTTVGIHRDDLVMRIGNYPLRKYGSQGQQKSFLIALKLAQFELFTRQNGRKPILLLDDIFDKLDMGRVERLIKLVSDEMFGQIYITDSNKVRLEGILASLSVDYKLFEVEKGQFKEVAR